MRLKKFHCTTIREGIDEIKHKYGPDVFIVDVKNNGTGFSDKKCEITIAMDEKQELKEDEMGPLRRRVEETWDTFLTSLKQKVDSLESGFLVERIKGYPLSLRVFIDKMVANGLDRTLAISIVSELYWEIGKLAEDGFKANFFLKHVLNKRIGVIELQDTDEHICIVGPTGSGKTEVVKKLATKLKEGGADISIVAYDPIRKGTYDELISFSKDEKIPLSFTINDQELPFMIEGNGNRRKIIDLPGHIEIQKTVLKRFKDIKKLLVFQSSTRYESIKTYCQIFGDLNPAGLIFTKLDEEERLGHIVCNIIQLNYPVCLFTSGINLDDVVFPNEDVLFRMLLERNPWRKRELLQ